MAVMGAENSYGGKALPAGRQGVSAPCFSERRSASPHIKAWRQYSHPRHREAHARLVGMTARMVRAGVMREWRRTFPEILPLTHNRGRGAVSRGPALLAAIAWRQVTGPGE